MTKKSMLFLAAAMLVAGPSFAQTAPTPTVPSWISSVSSYGLSLTNLYTDVFLIGAALMLIALLKYGIRSTTAMIGRK